MESKEKFYQKWWFWVIIICIFIVLIISLVLFSKGKQGVGTAGISIEEFDEIQIGMTMTEVCKIINNENMNNVKSQQLEKIEDITGTLYKYRYEGEKKGYAIITYELSTTDLWSGNGIKVITKEKFNLK